MLTPTENTVNPAATDETNENARRGAQKRRDPSEPAAVVGLGASAGGIAVLQEFFAEMPARSGLAFVVVMHLSPEHESNLAHILQAKTSMPVMQVNEPVKVEPNHVYVIPPNKQLAFVENTLSLVDPQQAIGRRVTIDLFFRTLAQSYGQRSIAIILSGTDSDGVIGLKQVRAQGGVTIAQDPKEAEYESMPLTAISTGMTDWVLPVGEMPSRLLDLVRNEDAMRLPPEIPEAPEPDRKVPDAPGGETISDETCETGDENALRSILMILRRQTGNDFSHYKRATLLRRIARRLQVNSLESLPEYLEFLRQHPAEATELLRDLLIGVTHFFRDQKAFAALEPNIPQLFAGTTRDDQLRVWVAGCATGEEAYSLAMLLCEHAERLPSPPSIQIFATDIDEQSIHEARQGIYPTTIEADVSNERLRRFFGRDHGRYRVRKSLREKILFAAHNLLSDAPFSNLDLISCRNLLIYLNAKAQAQVFDVFHFSLRAGGLLYIGGAENVSGAEALFSPVDGKHRIYVRRSVPRPAWKIPLVPLRALARTAATWRTTELPALTPNLAQDASAETHQSSQAGQKRRSMLFSELHLKLLEEYAPPSLVVNQAHDIVHLSDHAGRYLQFAAGEPTANLLHVVHPALQIELRTALFRAMQSNKPIESAPVTLEIDGQNETVIVKVQPASSDDAEQGFYLVIFARQSETAPAAAPSHAATPDALARDLQAEIDLLKRQLGGSAEQYEAAAEELKATNEELQAMNEEMRSATEELETSKEELQSVNEELVTVNHELKSNVEELSSANADLTNLMSSTDIGTIFLDRQLRIQRFTPSVQKIFNLLPADVGRPIADITSKLASDDFISDAQKVLDDLQPIEGEVLVGSEQWFLVRVAPYRTAEDRIAGVAVTFVDVTRRRQAEEDLRQLHEQTKAQLHKFNTVMAAVPDFVYQFDVEGRFTYISQSLLDLWRLTHDQAIGRNFEELDYPPELAAKLQRQIQEVIGTGEQVKDETPYTSAAGERIYEYILFPLLATDGSIEGVGGVTRDSTGPRRAVEALRASEERFREFAENSADVFWILDAKTLQLEYLNPVYERMYGQSREIILRDRQRWLDLVHPDDLDEATSGLPVALDGKTFVRNYRVLRPTDGATRWIRDTGFPIRDEEGEVVRVAGVAQDVTEDHENVAALLESEERFRLLIEGAPDYAMFLLDPANHIIYWSAGAERIFGWSAQEVLGCEGTLIFTPEERAQAREQGELQTALREGVAPDKRWHMRKDGSRVWIDGVMRRLDDEQGNLRGFAKIARDATAAWEAEETLRRSRADLEVRVEERTAEIAASKRELEAEIKQRTRLEQELLLVSEREKRRIGQDLHDSLCQELAAAAFFLQSTSQKLAGKDPAAARALAQAAKIVNDNVGLARDLARGLHPVELSASGLTNALRELAFRTHDGVTCRFECPRTVRVTDDAVALNLYRIAQEAVNNSLKHGRPTEIVISLTKNRNGLILTIGDNGVGITTRAAKNKKGMGLHIMRYRANVIGAECVLEPRKPKGARVRCVCPGPA